MKLVRPGLGTIIVTVATVGMVIKMLMDNGNVTVLGVVVVVVPVFQK
jgi:hypothetical protein